MTKTTYDVVAVGNAIIDLIQSVPDAFLIEEDIPKDATSLIEEDRADHLTRRLTGATMAAGGSAANTMTGVASFGATAGYIGKVADDALGERFRTAFRAAGVAFDTAPRPAPPGTARSIIAVTPDGHRSMNTYLGASTFLTPQDIDANLIRAGGILFLEGYLFDRDDAKAAFVHAAEIARAAGRQVSLTLSDKFCVDRHRDSFKHLVSGHVDILFANEAEILALFETRTLDDAINAVRAACPIAAITRSAEGSIVVTRDDIVVVPALPVSQVVDSTGAGDQYAAGFLFGHGRERSLSECGALASLAASEVISHIGPRPQTNLRALALSKGYRV